MQVPTVQGWVVLLPPHDHPEFGKPGMHYHVDWRFHEGVAKQAKVIFSDESPVYEDRVMVRDNYTIDMPTQSLPRILGKRFDRLTACGKCPHKGLTPQPIGEYGEMQCPGHGICFTGDGAVVKEFYLELGGSRVKIDLGTVSLSPKHPIETDRANVQTPLGTNVAYLPLSNRGPFLPEDIVKFTLIPLETNE